MLKDTTTYTSIKPAILQFQNPTLEWTTGVILADRCEHRLLQEIYWWILCIFQTLDLLAETIEHRPLLKGFIGMMEQLDALIDRYNTTPHVAPEAASVALQFNC